MENGWKMEDGKWNPDSSPLCVARKPWRGSPSGPSEETADPTLPTSGLLANLVCVWVNFRAVFCRRRCSLAFISPYACPQAFRRTNPPPELRTQESLAALSFEMAPGTRRTNRGPP
jgi:hypothetical protein